jgi:hypothetical protein
VIVVNSHSDNPGVASEGYARITSDDEIAVEVLFSLFDGSGNLLTNTSVLPRPATDQGTVLLKVDTVNGAAGNIALVNPAGNGQAAVIAATLRDAFGNDLGDAEINLAAGAKTAAVWTEVFGNLAGANGFAGTVEFTSNVPVIALPLFQTGIELTTQDILPARP